MRVYCFKCKSCDIPWTANIPEWPTGRCPHCGEKAAIRDYKEEGVSVSAAVGTIQRDRIADDRRDLILPTRDDFVRASGGDERLAQKKINDWNERHTPQHKGGEKYRPK